MSSMDLLIMLITTIAITAAAVLIITQVINNSQDAVKNPQSDTYGRVINIIGENVSNQEINHVRISITTPGTIKLNDTLLTIQTQNNQAKLRYRNGTLERNITSGFYTQ